MTKKETIILGCGVSGLSTGICLLEAGYASVKIIAAQLPPHTTSDKAAAIWFPYKANPQDLVLKWSMESYRVFEELAKDDGTGVSFVEWFELKEKIPDEIPWWAVELPASAYRKAQQSELPKGYSHANVVRVPMIETPIYMPYLLQQFEKKGGKIEQKRIADLEEVLEENPQTFLINCTGLGSRELCEDSEVYPIQGHIVQLEADINQEIRYLADEEGRNALAYMMPRKDCIVLGGTAEAHQADLTVDKEVVADILERCELLQPKLKGRKVMNSYVGLRPFRSVIRLEQEKNRPIVHNYGHGGSGFTVSWGCAKEVLRLLDGFAFG